MTTLTGADPALQVTAERPRLQRLVKGGVGTVSFTVTLHNTSSESLPIVPAALEVQGPAGSKLVATCPYERAVVVETAGARRKFTQFRGPLAPGERVKVRLFFTWPRAVVLPPGELVFRLTIDADGTPATVTSRPFTPEEIGGI